VATTGTACMILNDSGQVFVWGYGILGKGPKVKLIFFTCPLTCFHYVKL
jgi:alpha-tubulin suppressor-like RCC1 family protein